MRVEIRCQACGRVLPVKWALGANAWTGSVAPSCSCLKGDWRADVEAICTIHGSEKVIKIAEKMKMAQ